ncbi:hypothetical protein CHS0354_018382 [Potamilus streckersoni]|uniref:arginine--tRNA ligase n=1 Tax=Potamilus streckersoni TaxID=2493646 RepID=A0AAE0TBN1_9BIVA|nr:hypothetical protein CHS0354_018382 [Potamilus streckersoni]
MTGFHPLEHIRRQISSAVVRAFPDMKADLLKFETPPDPALGHIALSCFSLAKTLRKNPQETASGIADLPYSDDIAEAKAVGPYVNFFINTEKTARTLFGYLSGNHDYGSGTEGQGKTIMVEFSSPNTNKPLHIGHARNNTLGMTFSNLMEKLGYKVIRANLVNDRGIHICKSMLAYQKWGNAQTPEQADKKGDRFVGDWYVAYSKAEKAEAETGKKDLENEVREMLIRWENDDPDVRALWKKMNGWVHDGFKTTYDRTGVKFDRYYYESDLYVGGREEVLKALDQGICTKEDNGAVSIDLSDLKLGKKILLRGDGTSIYMTQDVYTAISKHRDYPLDGSFYVVADEQDNHFRVLFAVLKKFGHEWANRFKAEAMRELRIREERAASRPESELLETAEIISQSAVKYMMLRTTAAKGFMFDIKEALSFDGVTGPYLQYTHARIASILDKAGDGGKYTDNGGHKWNEDEALILLSLCRFPDVIISAAKERNPSVLAGYVYDLCRAFNRYYVASPILKTDDITRAARLNLCRAVKYVIRESLTLMTITPLERM